MKRLFHINIIIRISIPLDEMNLCIITYTKYLNYRILIIRGGYTMKVNQEETNTNMNKNNNITELTCQHCNYKWCQRYTQRPKSCPACKSYRYDKEALNKT
jgi:hypothetical protein